jgi:hypothetical protein
MSSSYVLVVPIIAAVVVGVIIVALAVAFAVPAIRAQKARRWLASEQCKDLLAQVHTADQAICGVIEEWETYPGSQEYVPQDKRNALYGAHASFQELERKGITT